MSEAAASKEKGERGRSWCLYGGRCGEEEEKPRRFPQASGGPPCHREAQLRGRVSRSAGLLRWVHEYRAGASKCILDI